MNEFQYAPLDLGARSFRLLRLLHGSKSEIECEIFEAVFKQKHLIPYEALSYAWGNLETPHTIKLNNERLAITDNLHVALQHLRIEDEDRILWVDAICIDQKNERERGHQVQRMGDIYSRAEQVVFWLGSATLETDLVMSTLKRLGHLSREHTSTSWPLSNEKWLRSWVKSQPDWDDTHIQQRNGLIQLLRRPWFERVWVLQEVANAKRAVVCVGDQVVTSRVMGFAPAMFDVHERPRSKSSATSESTIDGAVPDRHFQAVLDIMPGPLRQRSWWGQRRDLHTLLHKFSGSRASDPRDMVYALIGISSDSSRTGIIRPDYTKSTEQLIEDVTSFIFPNLPIPAFRTMDTFLRYIMALSQWSFYGILMTQDRKNVVDSLSKACRGWNVEMVDAKSHVAGEAVQEQGATFIEALLDINLPGLRDHELSFITAAAIKDLQSRPLIPQVLFRHSDEDITDRIANFAIGAAKSDIGYGGDFHDLVKNDSFMLSSMVDVYPWFMANTKDVWNEFDRNLSACIESAGVRQRRKI